MSMLHLRCEPGDLVMIVGPAVPDECLGKIVLIAAAHPIHLGFWVMGDAIALPRLALSMYAVADAAVRPIRDRGGVDEMVLRAGAPPKITLSRRTKT